MGQAKQRGTRDQRVAEVHARIEASRPAKLVCNSCNADVTEISPVSTRGLVGVEAIWMGQCACGNTTFAASGKPEAVQAFFDALSTESALQLGSQRQDGSGHENL